MAARTHSILLTLVLLFGWGPLPVLPQEEGVSADRPSQDQESGLKCLLEVCRHFGVSATVAELRTLSGAGPAHPTMVELSNAARRKGLSAIVAKMSLDKLSAVKHPFVIERAKGKFVVVEPFRRGRFRVIDPLGEPYYVQRDEFSNIWDGNVLAISKRKADRGGEPNIIFSEYYHDFGTLEQEKTLKHVYRFSNTGGERLVISRLRSTCGCMAALLSDKEIPPGGSGQVELTFKSGHRRGPQKFRAYVTSNDPDEPIVGITLAGKVKADVVISPRMLRFDDVQKGMGAMQRIIILEGEHRIKIARVDFSSKYLFGQTFPFRLENNAGYELVVALSPEAPAGALDEKVTILIEEPRKEKIEIPVRGNVAGQIAVSPESLFFGFVKKGTSIERRITITNTADDTFTIKELEFGADYLALRLLPVREGREYVIEATLTENAPPGKIEQSLKVFTDSTHQPVIEIPIYAVIEE
jgi:hypothetical protein